MRDLNVSVDEWRGADAPAREAGPYVWRAAAFSALLGIAGLGLAGLAAAPADDGPVEPVWDRTPCAHCTMLVGDRAFAAQIITQDGRALDFDDPGCLFLYEEDGGPAVRSQVRAEWFRHARVDRWVRSDRAAFVHAAPTPMAFGLGAVDAGTPGALSLDAARLRVVRENRGGGR